MQGRGYSAGRIQLSGHLLLLGMIGQIVCYDCLFPQILKSGMDLCVTALLIFPWALVFGITFFRGPWPFGLRPFRLCLLLAMGWYASTSSLVELIAVFHHYQSSPGVHPPLPVMLVAHVVMYAGWLSFIPFTRMCIFLRDLERKQAADRGAERHDQTGPATSE